MLSKLDTIMSRIFVPKVLDFDGIPATHTIVATGDEVAATVIVKSAAVPVGEYGERMEMQTALQIPSSSGAVVGDTFTVDGTATPDDPYPDDVIWKTVQLLSDDGTFRKFVVQKS